MRTMSTGGLPFPSLPAAGTEGGPAAEAVINGETIQMGRMVRDPNTGLSEPVYDQSPGGDYGPEGFVGRQAQTPSPGTSDPVTLAEWHGEQALSQLSVFDQQIAGIKAPVQHELDTSYKQYQVDVDTIRNSGMEQDQQRQRLGQLNANYQKKWIGLKGKMEPQTQALEQQKAAAQRQIVLQQALRMKEIQTYAKMAEEGVINEDAAKSLQYKVLGYDVPVTEFRPPKSQSPYKVVQETQGTLKILKNRLDSFKTDTHNPKGWGKTQRKRQALYVMKPGATGSLDTDWELAGPEQQAVYANLLSQYTSAQEVLDAAASQLVGRRVANLSGAASTIANDIGKERPHRAPAVTQKNVSQMSDDELRRLVSGGQ